MDTALLTPALTPPGCQAGPRTPHLLRFPGNNLHTASPDTLELPTPPKRTPDPIHEADVQKGPQEKDLDTGVLQSDAQPHTPREEAQRGTRGAVGSRIPSPRSPSPLERGMATLEPLGAARREDAWDFFF